ncbi:MAG: hypothetical protein COU42_01640 [Candidatus Nealsonbacteria bacterium CG10_big_fil_rev_8_21_14_0_10_36_24]|uniref:Thioredoxin domain-containing protein n=2 Tax=Candidatus Nealsoniibacteriota TaxID=1817911 RepID=A0A2H0YMT6_9BACT|nr:MAG: hypothetical protein COU42_01640 [Candidatus Nealsonbacteria bacterium CG10_big_fil_rev_8_21_14_0_10_36_24]PIS39817.1 MAG: hypothetical protein COT32_03045 [Candidatus Nealsonbacteria bacterium CG08_land_8_20_14_0_20_36_22]
MIKKFIFVILFLGLLFGIFNFVLALRSSNEIGVTQENKIEINFFYSPTCPHCAKEWEFLKELEKKYPEIKINRISIYEKDNVELLKEFYRNYNVPSEYYGMVPATFTSRYFIGFNEEIRKAVEECILECKKDIMSQQTVSIIDLEGNISIPILGKINIKKYSLPLLAVILGALDGFNVCSLGALVLILGLVLALHSRKKIFIFGGLFILTTAVIYGFLIVLWYQIFSLLVPYIRIMEILIGLLGIGGGIYFLKQFIKFRKQGPTCDIGTGKQIISKFSFKFQKSLRESKNILLLIGLVVLFAGIVTIIEFPCSAAVPVVFAGILSQSHLPSFFYLLYITFYLIFYLLDEIIVFLIAFFTMKIWLSSSKVTTWIILVQAIILFGLGAYYLFGFYLFR